MTDPLTEEQFLAGARVLHSLAPDTCKACDGLGGDHERGTPCTQCNGTGTVSRLDRLAKAVGLERHPGEQDDALLARIVARFWGRVTVLQPNHNGTIPPVSAHSVRAVVRGSTRNAQVL